MCVLCSDEVEEKRFIWCCGDIERVKRRDDEVMTVDIKWDEQFMACGES